MASKEPKTEKKAAAKTPEPTEGGIPIEGYEYVEQDPGAVIVVPDYIPLEQPAVQEAITEKWVARIEKFLKEQVWFQLNHEQYEAVIKELKTRL